MTVRSRLPRRACQPACRGASLVPLLLGLLALASACNSVRDNRGSALVHVVVSGRVTQASVVRMDLAITAASGFTEIDTAITKSSSGWSALVGGIPAGPERVFTIRAYDAGNVLIYQGAAPHVTILPAQTATVSIIAQEVNVTPLGTNNAPIIDSLVASRTQLPPGQTADLLAAVHDVDANDPLGYLWTADAGTFSAATTLGATYTAPQTTGPVNLTFKVTDSHGAYAAQSFQLLVQTETGAGGADIAVRLNTWPVVTSVTTQPAQLDLGDQTLATITASDADGDPLTYNWTADCPGVFESRYAFQTHFTPTTGAAGVCRLSAIADDGRGGTNEGSITIFVGPPPTPAYIPAFDRTYQSSPAAYLGKALTISLQAHDPSSNAGTISFAWTSSSNATLLTPVDGPGRTQRNVTTQPCSGDATVTVTATNSAGGLSDSRVFTIGTCPLACNDLLDSGSAATDGVYTIQPHPAPTSGVVPPPFNVWCDLTGGGWTLIGKLGAGVGDSAKSDFTSDLSTSLLLSPSAPAGDDFAHYDLNRFAGLGSTFVIKTATDANGDGSHYQYSFFRNRTPATGCTPGCAGTNWLANRADTALSILTSSSTTGANNYTWLETQYWAGGSFTLALFSYRYEPLADAVTNCNDAEGQSRYCHAPSGGIVAGAGLTGTLSSAYGNADGVPHGWGKSATYWIKHAYPIGIP